MCSILGVTNLQPSDDLGALRKLIVSRSQRQRHRGPDQSGIYVDDGVLLAHELLSIVGVNGTQPLRSQDSGVVLIANAEIYNHRELRDRLQEQYAFRTDSDCEVINALYRTEEPSAFLNQLNGIFAFIIWDRVERRLLAARDPIGVCPLYWGHDHEGRLWISSEMKAIAELCPDVEQFPPGHFFDSRVGKITKYYDRPWREYSATKGKVVTQRELRAALEQAVYRQMMCDVPFGVLLSGGLDSSLIAACAMKNLKERRLAGGHGVRASQIHSFCIGLNGSPDLAAAQVAANALNTINHSFHFTLEEGLDALPDVIRHIETYDVTTIRASTPMYMLARRIKALGFKMVLSGEGSDEIFGGYLYFHKAPSAKEFHEETVRKLDALHLFDCLRANKSMMAWGVEARVPFLDTEFIDVAMRMDAAEKMIHSGKIEKEILRQAFTGYLPASILRRQKEQFSDGVGYSWIDGMKAYAERQVSDSAFAEAAERFPFNTPQSKEAFLYRSLFAEHFPDSACARTVPGGKSIACSSPAAIAWDAAFDRAADPSGRAVEGIHNSRKRVHEDVVTAMQERAVTAT